MRMHVPMPLVHDLRLYVLSCWDLLGIHAAMDAGNPADTGLSDPMMPYSCQDDRCPALSFCPGAPHISTPPGVLGLQGAPFSPKLLGLWWKLWSSLLHALVWYHVLISIPCWNHKHGNASGHGGFCCNLPYKKQQNCQPRVASNLVSTGGAQFL